MSIKDFNEFFITDKLSDKTRNEISKRFTNRFDGGTTSDLRCSVCRSPLRPQIEELLYAGVPNETVRDYIAEHGYRPPSEKVLKGHMKRHCGLVKANERAMQAVEESEVSRLVAQRLTNEGVLNAVINLFADKIERGDDVKVTATNAIKAVEVKHKLEGNYAVMEAFSRLYSGDDKVIEGEVVECADTDEKEQA